MAPSPIANVYLFGFASLTIVTIWAFYFGETLQPSTTSHLSEIFINFSFLVVFLGVFLGVSFVVVVVVVDNFLFLAYRVYAWHAAFIGIYYTCQCWLYGGLSTKMIFYELNDDMFIATSKVIIK